MKQDNFPILGQQPSEAIKKGSCITSPQGIRAERVAMTTAAGPGRKLNTQCSLIWPEIHTEIHHSLDCTFPV